MGATAFLPVRNCQRPHCARTISGPSAPPAPHAATAARFGHETDTKTTRFYMVFTWFLHGFLRPQAVQPPLTPALAPPEKTLFLRSAPDLRNEPTAWSASSCVTSSVASRPNEPTASPRAVFVPLPLAHAASSILHSCHSWPMQNEANRPSLILYPLFLSV